jgi:dihydrofolate reductase
MVSILAIVHAADIGICLARFARSLVSHGLVDEFRLVVVPIALGRGLPLFSELSKPLGMKLVSSTTFSAGTMANVYVAA